MLERERQEGKGGASPSSGFPGGKARHWNLSTLPPSLPPPLLLAPEGCWQLDRQTDSAHIDQLTGTEPECEPLNTQAWKAEGPEKAKHVAQGLEEHMCL